MTANKKRQEEKSSNAPGIRSSLKDDAAERLAHFPKNSPDLRGRTAEELIHELKVHQIELEMQAEELRRAHLVLERSRDMYLDLYDFAPLGYLTLTDKALIIKANLNGALLLGVERNKLLKARFGKFIAAEGSDQWSRYFLNVMDQGGKQTCTLNLIRGDGTAFPARLESIRIEDTPPGRPTVRMAISDITDIRRAEEALRQSETRFEQMAEQSCTVTWEADLDGVFTYVSNVSEAVWGFSPDELVGRKHFYDLVVEAERESIKSRVFEVLKHKERFVGLEHAVKAKDGRTLWNSTSGIPLLNADGTLRGYQGSDTDISERKRAEAALQEVNRKLNLLSSITRHDIKNQLMVLEAHLALLKMKRLDLASDDHLLQAETAAKRISVMIRFTKEYEDIGVRAPIWQDVQELVRTASEGVHLENVVVVNDVPAGIEVFADPLISKVFNNLMSNAVKHGGNLTTIHFFAKDVDGACAIVCEDDGQGISADARQNLFVHGFEKDHGLGLFLSREILSITGITIEEASEPGRGARFVMTVPRNGSKVTSANGALGGSIHGSEEKGPESKDCWR